MNGRTDANAAASQASAAGRAAGADRNASTALAQSSALPTEGKTAYKLERTGIHTVSAYPPTNQTALAARSRPDSSNRRGR